MLPEPGQGWCGLIGGWYGVRSREYLGRGWEVFDKITTQRPQGAQKDQGRTGTATRQNYAKEGEVKKKEQTG